MNLEKPLVIHDEKKLEWIRSQACCHCGRPPRNDPHHVLKRDRDDYTVPLCRRCHKIVQPKRVKLLKEYMSYAEEYHKRYIQQKGGRMFYSVICTNPRCREQHVLEAKDEEDAKFIFELYKNCGCLSPVRVLPTGGASSTYQGMSDEGQETQQDMPKL